MVSTQIRLVPRSPDIALSRRSEALEVVVQAYGLEASDGVHPIVVLWVAGALNASTLGAVRDAAIEVKRRGTRRIAIEASLVSELDFAAVDFLVDAANAIRAGAGDFRLLNPSETVKSALRSFGALDFLAPKGTFHDQLVEMVLRPHSASC